MYVDAQPLIQISSLDIHRGNRLVISDVDLELSEGEVVALVGPNGCGKTTLIESSAGMHAISSGKISWRYGDSEMKIIRDSEGRRNSLPPMGLTLQKNGMSGEETVEERINTALVVSGCDVNEIQVSNLLNYWGLDHRNSDRVSQLSGGLARRLAVLSGLAPAVMSQNPRTVLLDEPSEGLDESGIILLVNWLRALASKGHGVMLATHDPRIILAADRVIRFDENNNLSEELQVQSLSNYELPIPTNEVKISKILSLFNWAYKMEKRNPVDTIGRFIPSVLALLMIHTLISEDEISVAGADFLAAMILLPSFISVVIPPALISRYAEENCGQWWAAVIGPKFRPVSSIIGSSIILPLPLIYVSWLVLSDNVVFAEEAGIFTWLWLPGLVMFSVAIAASALHLLVSDLRRTGASVVSLLMLILVWPFIELVDALVMIMNDGMSFGFSLDEPLSMIFLSFTVSILVWAISVYLPDA
jgi:ABC-type multidrug transport system ATPase subunit